LNEERLGIVYQHDDVMITRQAAPTAKPLNYDSAAMKL
jgi:hypothetical protein